MSDDALYTMLRYDIQLFCCANAGVASAVTMPLPKKHD